MPTKHYYFVSGLDPQGDKFAGSCVAGDIINAINLFRNICHSVHEIKMGVQAPADHDECITVLNGIEYTTIIAKGGVDKKSASDSRRPLPCKNGSLQSLYLSQRDSRPRRGRASYC